MKNHRYVCYATNAGYTEYRGLPGRVRTGCPNTPAYKSVYCNVHKPVIAIPTGGDVSQNNRPSAEPVALIVGVRQLRNKTLYEVTVHETLFWVQIFCLIVADGLARSTSYRKHPRACFKFACRTH